MGQRFSIKLKVLGMSVAISLLSVVIGAISFYFGQKVQLNYSVVTTSDIPKLSYAQEMNLAYRQVRVHLRTLGIADLSSAEIATATQGTMDAIEHFERAELAYITLEFEKDQEALYKNMQKTWSEFKEIGGQVLALSNEATPEAHQKMVAIFLSDCPRKAKDFSEAINALTSLHRNNIEERVARAESLAADSTIATWAIIALGLLAGIFLGAYIASATSKELRAIAGDLFGNANEVSGTVSNLTASANALSSAASEQAAALQETVASIEEIRAMVQRNSESALESAKVSAQSKNEANQGKESVHSMIRAVKEIDESNHQIKSAVENGNDRMANIVDIIHEIETKTNVINEIVFQTKLLSFNASVEAARAGEHGKGFAVVADEINNLATMSGNAAKEIAHLLHQSSDRVKEIVTETTSSVNDLMVQAHEKVSHGNHLAEECGSFLEKIVSNADQLSLMVESISTASQEQAAGVDEIARAIEQLDRVTHLNSSETQRTSDSATHLSGQVKSLNGSSYKLQVLIEGKTNSSGTLVNTFAWNDRYLLGVEDMDEEHKILIARINALARAVNEGAEHSILVQCYNELASYTEEHFSDEEAFMQSINYPEAKAHQKVHQALLAKVGEFGRQVKAGSFDSEALIEFLNDWLIKHILGVDMKYAHFTRHDSTHSKSNKAA